MSKTWDNSPQKYIIELENRVEKLERTRPGNPTTKLELIWYYVANSVLGVTVLAILWTVLTLPGS